MLTKETYHRAAVAELEPLSAKVETTGLSQCGQNLKETDAKRQTEGKIVRFSP